jgi:cell shape-determining protein MreD
MYHIFYSFLGFIIGSSLPSHTSNTYFVCKYCFLFELFYMIKRRNRNIEIVLFGMLFGLFLDAFKVGS